MLLVVELVHDRIHTVAACWHAYAVAWCDIVTHSLLNRNDTTHLHVPRTIVPKPPRLSLLQWQGLRQQQQRYHSNASLAERHPKRTGKPHSFLCCVSTAGGHITWTQHCKSSPTPTRPPARGRLPQQNRQAKSPPHVAVRQPQQTQSSKVNAGDNHPTIIERTLMPGLLASRAFFFPFAVELVLCLLRFPLWTFFFVDPLAPAVSFARPLCTGAGVVVPSPALSGTSCSTRPTPPSAAWTFVVVASGVLKAGGVPGVSSVCSSAAAGEVVGHCVWTEGFARVLRRVTGERWLDDRQLRRLGRRCECLASSVPGLAFTGFAWRLLDLVRGMFACRCDTAQTAPRSVTRNAQTRACGKRTPVQTSV